MSKAGVRYLVRVKNFGIAPTVENCSRVKQNLKMSAVDVYNVRIASTTIEFDIFAQNEAEAQEQVKKVGALFEVTSARNLSSDRQITTLEDVLKETSQMLQQERYWEAHELLESIWRSMAKGGEKELLQGLILLCAAHVHNQKGRKQVAISILTRALKKLESYQDEFYHGANIQKLRESVSRQIMHGELQPKIDITFHLNSQ